MIKHDEIRYKHVIFNLNKTHCKVLDCCINNAIDYRSRMIIYIHEIDLPSCKKNNLLIR